MNNEIFDSSRLRHPLVEEFLALLKYRDLIRQFVSRALKTRYKRSWLGVVWTMLNPLLTMSVLTLVFSSIFRFDIQFYPVYLLSGIVMWQFFASTTSAAMGDMLFGGSLFGRIFVPKTVFAVSAVGTGLVNLGISFIPLVAIALVLGVKIHLAVLVLPVSVFLLALFALGIGLVLATAAAFFADMVPVYEVILMVWMYTTPIFYPMSIIHPRFLWIFKLNPMVYFLAIFRQPIYSGVIPEWSTWLVCIVASVVAFIIGGLLFTSKSNEYAYRL